MTNDKLREALETIQQWDCLNPPRVDLLADLAWLRRTVDAALAAPVEAEPVALGILCLDAMSAEQLEAYDYAGNEFMAAAELLLDEAEAGKPLAGVAHARWQSIRERIHKLAHPAEQAVEAEPVAWRYWESKYNEWEYNRYPVDGRTCEPLYAHPAKQGKDKQRDHDWILAMGNALGMGSGFRIPVVPTVEAFQQLFAAIRAAEQEKDAEDAAIDDVLTIYKSGKSLTDSTAGDGSFVGYSREMIAAMRRLDTARNAKPAKGG